MKNRKNGAFSWRQERHSTCNSIELSSDDPSSLLQPNVTNLAI